jgi:hypothetical protein
MTKGVLLFCFDTAEVQYHRILERCVALIKQNLRLEITVVTDYGTYKKLKPLGFINYKFIEPELGNTKNGSEWRNVDRHMAYELSPYDVTLVMDIDYFSFTDNLRQFLDTDYDFLVSKDAHDLTNVGSFDMRKWSMIDMVWATVFVFKKGPKARRIFDTVKYVKQYYHHFNEMYRIRAKNFRNDYAFAIALQQVNGFTTYDTMPLSIATLPPGCKVIKMTDTGIAWSYNDQINYTEHQDVHVLNKELADV